ncbi:MULTISPECIES: twin-arginine translocase TatA/TatE family subunit [unclassified Actinotalea]|uniref:twin-arginine translocase TatA/TatE family subunit n=1 Tax=unclassified Actinotalea TaxID=2638618 RepID=UPI0015F70EA0|nr:MULTISPECIES: twin-arginine translocase TatA/TatE family subunit [unclassified Actinotalea]
MRTPSVWAIVIIAITVVVLFGASKLPEIAGNVGKSLKIFKKEVQELREDTSPLAPPTAPAPAPAVTPALATQAPAAAQPGSPQA